MIVELSLNHADWKRFQATVIKELSSTGRTLFGNFAFNLVTWMIFAIVFSSVFQNISQIHWPSFLAAALPASAVFGYWVFQSWRLRRAYRPSDDGLCLDHQTYEISERGIESKGNGYTSSVSWEIVQKICRLNGQILIFLDNTVALVFPEDKLDNPDELYAYILKFYGEK